MPLIQWIMQNLQPKSQDSALLGGSADINLEYQFPDVGTDGGAILGAETADFISKRVLRKLIRFIPGDIAFDVCTNQKWIIQSYYFDLNGFVKYIAYNNIQQVEFFEQELEIERLTANKNYLQAKNKAEYLAALSKAQNLKEKFVSLDEAVNFSVFKFLPGDIAFDVYKWKKWTISSHHQDINNLIKYIVTDGEQQYEFFEEELQLTRPSLRRNCLTQKNKDEYQEAKDKIEYLETHFSSGSISLSSHLNEAIFKYLPGDIVFDVYKKQKWTVVNSYADLNGSYIYTVSNNIMQKQFLEDELQSEKIIMEKLYEEAEQKLNHLQATSSLKKKGTKK